MITPIFLSSVLVCSQTQDVNIQNMNVELVAQMFKNYQSNVLFHLEGMQQCFLSVRIQTDAENSHREPEGAVVRPCYVWMIPLRRHDIPDLDCMDQWTCLGDMNIPFSSFRLFL